MTPRRTRTAGAPNAHPGPTTEWLSLDAVADVSIVVGGQRRKREPREWSGDQSGEQMIELRFHNPTSLRRLRLVSSETEQARTQEITVWVSVDRGERHRELLRQQFTFSPQGATEQVEEYAFQVDDVSTIQVRIVPSIDGRPAVAKVSELQVSAT